MAADDYYHEMEIGEIVKKHEKEHKNTADPDIQGKGMLKKLYGKEEPAYGKSTH